MNWYKTSTNGYDPSEDPNFVGYHCQRNMRSPNDDRIFFTEHYANEFFIQILDMLPFKLRDKALSLGLLNKPEPYSDEFDNWGKSVEEFLNENGVRWIFVSETRPLEDFGEYCYYVSIESNENYLIDVHVNDSATAYVYFLDGDSKYKPKLFEVPEEFDEEDDDPYWSGQKMTADDLELLRPIR